MKEKMIMKLEKDRLTAKVDNLEKNLAQIEENSALELKEKEELKNRLSQEEVKKKGKDKKDQYFSHKPAQIPPRDPPNPFFNEQPDMMNPNLSLIKTFKGHLMGVTALSVNSKKNVLATGSDDSTWKLWSIPNGELIMSGEGHQDWVGGVSFHPKGNWITTGSGDGTVKVWDILNACCAITYSEHPQAVWKVDYHESGDFVLSASMDHTVKLWDTNVPKSRFTFRGHVDSVNSVQF